jgi:hypothetical protein
MRVMMLLKSDANAESGALPDEKLLTDMGNYNARMVEAGVMIGGEGLHPTSEGAKVRISKGKTTVIDGPFAEAKEIVAGFFMLQTKSLQEAIEWAKQIPGAPADTNAEGEIELRPLFEMEDIPVDPTEQPGGWRDQEVELRQSLKAPGPEKGHRYISFIKSDKATEAMILSDKGMQEMGVLMKEMADKGVLISADGLKPTREGAKIILSSKNKPRVIDGPFSESKELIAGFTVYRAKTKAEAVEWARRCLQIHVDATGTESGEIEVRRVFETEEIPVAENEAPGGWRDQELKLREKLGQ